MASNVDDFASEGGSVERRFGDIAPDYSAIGSANAVQARARGAADRMWRKVEEDLDKIDRVDADEADDG